MQIPNGIMVRLSTNSSNIDIFIQKKKKTRILDGSKK